VETPYWWYRRISALAPTIKISNTQSPTALQRRLIDVINYLLAPNEKQHKINETSWLMPHFGSTPQEQLSIAPLDLLDPEIDFGQNTS
jgi:hypothetical protein